MKRTTLIAGTGVALLAATILVACGGGGSSSGSSGTPRMMGASGVITGFGSVFVNGREFATGMQTQVLDGDSDDAASATADLQVGMTVDIDAGSGTATMLRCTSAVRGEVDAVEPIATTMLATGPTRPLTRRP